MNTILGIPITVGGVALLAMLVWYVYAYAYQKGYSNGRDEGVADLVTRINEGKVEFDYVDIVPRKTPRSQ